MASSCQKVVSEGAIRVSGMGLGAGNWTSWTIDVGVGAEASIFVAAGSKPDLMARLSTPHWFEACEAEVARIVRTVQATTRRKHLCSVMYPPSSRAIAVRAALHESETDGSQDFRPVVGWRWVGSIFNAPLV